MREFNVDFHIHSRESAGTSPEMIIPNIAEQAELKGLDLVGTSDALHGGWLAHLGSSLEPSDSGVYKAKHSKTRFLVTTEVEDAQRVHHVILFPSLEAAENLRDSLKKHSVNLDSDGRPNIRLEASELADKVCEVGALIGPSHAFTPWTAIYKEYASLRDCYQDNLKHVKFLELGLSADTDLADRIAELADVSFLTNSDCHSPWPHRLGREFNRLKLKELSFPELVKAFDRKGGRKFTLNVGLNPKEGKYHLTGCSRCFTRFKIADAASLKMRCPECRGLIKIGVTDRIGELAEWDEPHHPRHRPPYIHILPLAEVCCLALGIRSPQAKKVQALWSKLVSALGTEINVLVDAPIEDVKKTEPEIGRLIQKFREDKLNYIPGAGGQYGRPTLKNEETEYWGQGQKTLGDF